MKSQPYCGSENSSVTLKGGPLETMTVDSSHGNQKTMTYTEGGEVIELKL